MLSAYIKILERNSVFHGDWEYELKNYQKRTLNDCINNSKKNIDRDVSYKSIYIDYLASIQSEKQLIKAYEVFNGFEEDCFIFTIKMGNNLFAIILENVLFARASELFIVDDTNYVKCINLIFDYFTDYQLKNKRFAIKNKSINADKFYAIKYETIDHDNLPIWVSKIKEIISGVKKQKGNIQFKSGLKIPKDSGIRNSLKDTVDVSNIHKVLMIKLFHKLSKIYGYENVGTEVNVGKKRIDLVVRNNYKYDIYEIKSDYDVRICIKQAIGQIFDYAYFECSENIGKMVIVGPSIITEEANRYLTKMRELHKINIYYETI